MFSFWRGKWSLFTVTGRNTVDGVFALAWKLASDMGSGKVDTTHVGVGAAAGRLLMEVRKTPQPWAGRRNPDWDFPRFGKPAGEFAVPPVMG